MADSPLGGLDVLEGLVRAGGLVPENVSYQHDQL